MVRLISRQRKGLAALKLTKLFGIDDFPAAKDSGKVLIIIIYFIYSTFNKISSFLWKLNRYSDGVQFGINCTALDQSKLSNFVECTIIIIITYSTLSDITYDTVIYISYSNLRYIQVFNVT